MRAVIIVSYFNSELWKLTEPWPAAKEFQQTTVRLADVDTDKILLLCQADSDEDAEDRAMIESRRITTRWLIELSNSANYQKAEVYVATHAGYVDINKLASQVSHKRFQAGADFSHERGLAMFDALFDLLNNPDSGSFETVVDTIKQEEKNTCARRLSTLKHRLAHVFLPVTVDLHAWQEFEFDDLYLQEIRDNYRSDEGRLERARSLLYRESSISDNVEKIICERQLEDDESWQAVKLLLPPKSREVEAETSNIYADFKRAKAVLESLKDRDKLMELRIQLRRENLFGAWCKDLYNHLSKLIGKVDQ